MSLFQNSLGFLPPYFGSGLGQRNFGFVKSGTAAPIPVDKYIIASGGTLFQSGDWKIRTFTSTDNFIVTQLATNPTNNLIKVNVVSGGGSGGAFGGGGGGAGGFLENLSYSLSSGIATYLCTVGAGGDGVVTTNKGNNGFQSSFDSLSTTGGGGGGGGVGVAGNNGGSGGGGAFTAGVGGSGTVGQGNAGGSGIGSSSGGSGGGGSSAAGVAGYTSFNGGNGGAGSLSSITGNYYSGGGGGAATASPSIAGVGGNGGGGNGQTYLTNGASAANSNTGGGGGGLWFGAGTSGKGGSGIIVISYYSPYSAPVSIGAPTNNHWAVGDSITTSPYVYPTSSSGYIDLFIAAKSVTMQNLGYPSQGIWKGFTEYSRIGYANIPDPYSLSLCMGLNDARDTPSKANTKSIIIGGAAAVFAKHYCSTLRSFADSTKVGTWLNYGPDPSIRSNPPRLNPTIQASQTVGNTASLAFNGDAIALTTLLQSVPIAAEGGYRGFTVHIDGVLKYTFDPSVLNCFESNSVQTRGGSYPSAYGWSPYAIILNGLNPGAHTCLITITAGNGSYFGFIDALVELYPYASVASTKPCAWLEVPTLNATGSAGSYTNAADIAEINATVWASTQFNWFKGYSNFGQVETNTYYNPNDAAQVYSDNIHPLGFGTISGGSYKIAQPLIQLMT